MSKEKMLLDIVAVREERILNNVFFYLFSQLHHLMLPLKSADDSLVALTKLNQAFSIGFYEVVYKIFMSSNVTI